MSTTISIVRTAAARRWRLACAIVFGSAVLVATPPASASQVYTVCAHGCPYQDLAPAVAAAQSGQTVWIGPGVFRGGVDVAKDLVLRGAGAGRTVVHGGGPVLTIGTFGAEHEPTVELSDLTISGGVTRSSPFGAIEALGGGIFVPPSAGSGVGATLTLEGSVVSGNVVSPGEDVDAGFSCGTSDCRFAHAGGGGIDSWGIVSVDRSVVAGNRVAGTHTSDADGAGIYAQEGSLTVTRSTIAHNVAISQAPNGRFAEGAGVMVDTFFSPGASVQFTMRDSYVAANASRLSTNLPAFGDGALIDMNANSGGIHVGDNVPTVIGHTTLLANSVSADGPNSEALAFDAGMLVGDSDATITGLRVVGNTATTRSLTSTDSGPGGSALEFDGGASVRGLVMTDNVATAFSEHGNAAVNGALAVLNFSNDPRLVTVRDGTISRNTTRAVSTTGTATSQGSAVFTNDLLTLRRVVISGNAGRAEAPHGSAQGGGIWNGVELSGPPVELSLIDTAIVRNRLSGTSGIDLAGGGLYTTSPVTRTRAIVAANTPDQCFGC